MGSIQYPLYNERYQNDGILRHFDYDSIITGSSMAENFLASRWDGMMGTNSVKIPFSGSSYKETGDTLERAFTYNQGITTVVRGLDSTRLIMDKDDIDYTDYPDYLYDNNPLNDVQYVLNKDVYYTFTDYLFTFNKQGGKTTSFDTYTNWAPQYEYNMDKRLAEHTRIPAASSKKIYDEYEQKKIRENLEQNVIRMVEEHPETDFYLFIPPYSICYFDDQQRSGMLDYMFSAWMDEINLLLPYSNVHLFAYFDQYDRILDLNNYADSVHYNQEMSNWILDTMASGVCQITEENKIEYMNKVIGFYGTFDYDTFFASSPEASE